MTELSNQSRILSVCGRYTLTADRHLLKSEFRQNILEYRPRYNCVPQQELLIVKEMPGTAALARWGLVTKQPHYIRVKDCPLIAFAGLLERSPDKNGQEVDTFTILTCDASDSLKDLHDRMPVIIPPKAYTLWLDTNRDPSDLLRPYDSDSMIEYRVSRKVNSPREDSADMIEEVQA